MEEYENSAEIMAESSAEETVSAAEDLQGASDITTNGDECKKQPDQPCKKRWVKILKIAGFVVAGLILALCLTVVIYWGCIGVTSFDEGVASIKKLFTPKPNDVLYKESYTVSNEELLEEQDEIVAVVGDQKLNNGTLQAFYWMNILEFLNENGYYAMFYGLDTTKPLDQQTNAETGYTWQQLFLKQALTTWHHYQALTLMGVKEGLVTEEDLKQYEIDAKDTLSQAALEGGYASVDALLADKIGPGCSYADYVRYLQLYSAEQSYLLQKYEGFELTDEDLEQWFADNEAQLLEQGITKESGYNRDVRHILIAVEGGTEDEDDNITYSDAEWEACRAEAQQVLDLWLAGDATEESFSELAGEYSEDPGSNGNGGLYEDLNSASGMVQEFTDWYMEENRQPGDYGLIKTSYGYHVMYFSGSEPEWLDACREGCVTDFAQQLLTEAQENYPMEVTYENIVLGEASLMES